MIFLDIETRPNKALEHLLEVKAPRNYKDEDKIKVYVEEKMKDVHKTMSVDPDLNEIICIGVKEDENEVRFIDLSELKALLDKHDKIVTFNGKCFDIPSIIKHGLRQGIELPYARLKRMCDRYDKDHIDLMTVIGEYGKYKSKDFYQKAYFNEVQPEIDHTTATIEEEKEHCKLDILFTERLYNLFEPIC